MFLPPLLAYELHSAIDRGEGRAGAASANRPERENWAEFLSLLHRLTYPGGILARREHGQRRRRVAARICRLFALRLLAEDAFINWNSVRTQGLLLPTDLVNLEAGRLSHVSSAPTLQACWDHLDAAAARQELERFLPQVELLALAAEMEMDPFLCGMLLGKGNAEHSSEPPVRGSTPKADNPRRILWPTGDFARRDLGALPDELGRLAPSELVLMRGLGRPAGSVAQSLQTLFLLRFSQGQFLQRYSSHSRHAFMEPTGRIQIELVTELEDHQLTVPPLTPVVSWYRAVAVQLYHMLACLRLEFRWSLEYVMAYSLDGRTSVVRLTDDAASGLAVSAEAALRVLTQACPQAFTSDWPVLSGEFLQPTTRPKEQDILVRITLGRLLPKKLLPAELESRSAVQLAVRIERAENGLWHIIRPQDDDSRPITPSARLSQGKGLPRTADPGRTHASSSLPCFDQTEDDPTLAAGIILEQVLWPATKSKELT